jgi:hypothetical protein
LRTALSGDDDLYLRRSESSLVRKSIYLEESAMKLKLNDKIRKRMKSERICALLMLILGVLLCSVGPVHAADLTVNVDASSYIRAIPETMYGTNTQCWDGLQNGSNDNFNNLMAASGRRYVRWPGGVCRCQAVGI